VKSGKFCGMVTEKAEWEAEWEAENRRFGHSLIVILFKNPFKNLL